MMPCCDEHCTKPEATPQGPIDGAHKCRGGCGRWLHGTCGQMDSNNNEQQNEMLRVCTACAASSPGKDDFMEDEDIAEGTEGEGKKVAGNQPAAVRQFFSAVGTSDNRQKRAGAKCKFCGEAFIPSRAKPRILENHLLSACKYGIFGGQADDAKARRETEKARVSAIVTADRLARARNAPPQEASRGDLHQEQSAGTKRKGAGAGADASILKHFAPAGPFP
ncbi:unnamed protein product, partial [Phaeothamnion confervicola]